MKTINKTITAGLLALTLTNTVQADEGMDKMIQITNYCYKVAGDYGTSTVSSCVSMESRSFIALSKLVGSDKPMAINSAVLGCMKRLEIYGYSLVLSCAKGEIRSIKGLTNGSNNK